MSFSIKENGNVAELAKKYLAPGDEINIEYDHHSNPFAAIVEIAEYYDVLLSEVIQRSAKKAKLIGLDAMGAELRPPSSATANVVFSLADSQSGRTVVPAGTTVGMQDDDVTVPFETTGEVVLNNSKLTHVLAFSNTTEEGEEQSDQLNTFRDLLSNRTVLTTHYLYLPLDRPVLPKTKLVIELTFESPIQLNDHEHVRGEVWATDGWRKPLKIEVDKDSKSFDGSVSLSLEIDEETFSAEAGFTSNNTHWIRLSIFQSSFQWPKVSSVKINSSVDCDVPLDYCVADGLEADTSAAFAPFGESPRPGSTWLVGHSSVFSREDSNISLRYAVVGTPANESALPNWDEAKEAFGALKKIELLNPSTWVTSLHEFLMGVTPYAWIMKGLGAVGKFVFNSSSQLAKKLSNTDGNAGSRDSADPPEGEFNQKPVVVLEALSDGSWQPLVDGDSEPISSEKNDSISFQMKGKEAIVKIPRSIENSMLGEKFLGWIRLRLVSGSFGEVSDVKGIKVVIPKPPRIEKVTLNVCETSKQICTGQDVYCVREFTTVENDHTDSNQTKDICPLFLPAWNAVGDSCVQFENAERDPLKQTLPDSSIFLCFDGCIPSDWNSLLLTDPLAKMDATVSVSARVAKTTNRHDQASSSDETFEWMNCEVEDQTRGLTKPGILKFNLKNTSVGISNVPFESASANQIVLSKWSAGTLAPRSLNDSFSVGSRCIIRDSKHSEFVEIVSQTDNGWRVRPSLKHEYQTGVVEPIRPSFFGVRGNWLRISLSSSLYQNSKSRFLRNAVEVCQLQTHSKEMLGNSDGCPNQIFHTRFSPILEDEVIEVLELEGRKAELGAHVLTRDRSVDQNDIRVVFDSKSGRPDQVWVRWHRKPDLLHSSESDRHFVVDRINGIIRFGDNVNGRIPPLNSSIVASSYKSGGGSIGNVDAGKINQVLSLGLNDALVTNPAPASGGADGDKLSDFGVGNQNSLWKRESEIDRFLRQNSLFRVPTPAAISAQDYETIARRVSSEIIEAVLLSSDSKRNATLVLLPTSASDSLKNTCKIELPEPLARKVKREVLRLAPVSMKLEVTPPEILDFKLLVKTNTNEFGLNEKIATWLRKTFFDPICGGVQGRGWLSQNKQNASSFSTLSVVNEKFPQVLELAFWPLQIENASLNDQQSDRILRVDPGVVPNLVAVAVRNGKNSIEETISVYMDPNGIDTETNRENGAERSIEEVKTKIAELDNDLSKVRIELSWKNDCSEQQVRKFLNEMSAMGLTRIQWKAKGVME